MPKPSRCSFFPIFSIPWADGPKVAIRKSEVGALTTKISSAEQAMDVLRRLRSNLIPVRVRFGCPSSCLFFDGYLAELCPLLEIDSTSGQLIFGGLLECEFGGELHEDDDGSVSLDLSVCRGEISLGIEAEADARIWNSCRWIQ